MIKFLCPKCGKMLLADGSHAGTKVKCPRCGVAFQIPQAGPESNGMPRHSDGTPTRNDRRMGLRGPKVAARPERTRGRSNAVLKQKTWVLPALAVLETVCIVATVVTSPLLVPVIPGIVVSWVLHRVRRGLGAAGRQAGSSDHVVVSGVGLGIFLLITVIVYLAVGESKYEANMRQKWQGVVNEYVRQLRPLVEDVDYFSNVGSGYLKGKVLVVELDRYKLDDAHFSLPVSIRPKKPDDVGSVVLTRRARFKVGTYTDGAAAYKHRCEVAVIDVSLNRLVATTVVFGTEPPQTKHANRKSPGEGSRPVREVADYLIRLERK